jgi:TM2 domain-containing membrane protein YozV
MALIRCAECGREVSSAAASCPACGHPINQPSIQVVQVNQAAAQAPIRKWSPGVAAVLSFFIPGVGQIYKGQVLNGIVWLIVVPIGYVMLIIPGVILHLCCIIGAAMGDPYK